MVPYIDPPPADGQLQTDGWHSAEQQDRRTSERARDIQRDLERERDWKHLRNQKQTLTRFNKITLIFHLLLEINS